MKKNVLIQISIVSLILVFFSTSSAFELEDLNTHAFFSQGYLFTDNNNYLAPDTEDGTFQFNEFGVNFTAQLADKLQAGIQIFGRDMGTVGNNEARLDWAFLNYRWKDWAGIKVGKMKLIYGLYNDSREIDMLRTPVLLPQSVYMEVYRDTMAAIQGVELYGNVPIKYLGGLGYNFQYGVLPFAPGDGVSQAVEFVNAGIGLKIDHSDCKSSYNIAATWTPPLEGLRLRYTYVDFNDLLISGNSDFGVIALDYKTLRFGVSSAEYTNGDLQLAGEYLDYRIDVDVTGVGVLEMPYKGWYGSGNYRFNDLFTLGLSYSKFDGLTAFSPNNLDYEGWLKTYTVSTKFDITDNWLVKFETSYNDGLGGIQPVYTEQADLERRWWLFAAKTTVHF